MGNTTTKYHWWKGSEKSFLSDPGKPGIWSLGPDVRRWVRDVCADLTDVTLADEDTKSILTDNANWANPSQCGGKIWN